jgi:hypothetical protein
MNTCAVILITLAAQESVRWSVPTQIVIGLAWVAIGYYLQNAINGGCFFWIIYIFLSICLAGVVP